MARTKKRPTKTTRGMAPDLLFGRIVRGIANDFRHSVRFQSSAIMVIKEAAEAYIISILEDAGMIAKCAGHDVLSIHHLRLAQRVRRHTNDVN